MCVNAIDSGNNSLSPLEEGCAAVCTMCRLSMKQTFKRIISLVILAICEIYTIKNSQYVNSFLIECFYHDYIIA